MLSYCCNFYVTVQYILRKTDLFNPVGVHIYVQEDLLDQDVPQVHPLGLKHPRGGQEHFWKTRS